MAKKKKDTPETGFESVENALSRTEQYIEDNQKSLTIIVVAVAVIILAYMGYKRFYLAPAEAEALSEIYMAEKYFETDSFQLALEGNLSYYGFLNIIDEYGVTKTANLARYYAGICYLHLGEYEEAINYLKKFEGKDIMVGTIALGAIGDAYVELGEYEEALSFYLKASERKKNDFTSSIYLKKAGGVCEELAQYDKALELYTEIEKDYPNSDEAYEIEKDIERCQIKQAE